MKPTIADQFLQSFRKHGAVDSSTMLASGVIIPARNIVIAATLQTESSLTNFAHQMEADSLTLPAPVVQQSGAAANMPLYVGAHKFGTPINCGYFVIRLRIAAILDVVMFDFHHAFYLLH